MWKITKKRIRNERGSVGNEHPSALQAAAWHGCALEQNGCDLVLFDPQFMDDPVFAEEDPIFAEENPISAEDPFVDAERCSRATSIADAKLPQEKINIAELVTLLNRMNRDLQNSLKDVASDYLINFKKRDIP